MFLLRPRAALDIGTGSGILSLMLAQRYQRARIHSIDINEEAVQQASHNFRVCAQSNPSWQLPSRVAIQHSAIQSFTGGDVVAEVPSTVSAADEAKSPASAPALASSSALPASELKPADEEAAESESAAAAAAAERTTAAAKTGPKRLSEYDLILCAPPYFKSDPRRDAKVKHMAKKRRLARHTHTLTMGELVTAVHTLLTPHTGRFYTIVSVPYPADDLEEEAQEQGLTMLEKITVRDHKGSKVLRFIYCFRSCPDGCGHCKTAGVEGGAAAVARELPVYAASPKAEPKRVHRLYSDRYKHMLLPFCVHFRTEPQLLAQQAEEAKGQANAEEKA